MDYLTFIERLALRASVPSGLQFLVSGSDPAVRNTVLADVARKCREEGQALLVIDDVWDGECAGLLRACGYSVRQGFSEPLGLWNPFQIGTLKGLSQLRQLLTVLGYDEKQKNKLIAYLSFLGHIESLGQGERKAVLSVEELGKYCSAMAVEERLQTLVEQDMIDKKGRMTLLAKYAECAAAAADFEDTLYLLLPLIRGNPLEPEAGQAVVFQTGALGEDETMRGLAALLLRFGLEERRTPGVSVVVLDKGRGRRESLFNFLKELSPCVRAHLFTEDVFTLASRGDMAALLSRFSVRIYGRHPAMSSAEEAERACGEIDVVKNSYNAAYDRRWSANRPWDVLLGRNRTESYTRTASVREPRYRKEMIQSFPAGTGIVEFMGSSTLFAV